jgi:hypothetical protein
MGSVFGRGQLTALISPITVQYRYTVEQQPYTDALVFGSHTFEYAEARGIAINADPVVLTLNLRDPYDGPTAPTPDPFPTTATVSGIDPTTVEVLLNDTDVFTPYRAGATTLINQFPNYGRIRLDELDYEQRSDCLAQSACLPLLRPQRLEFTYYPTLEQLRTNTTNELRVTLKDGVANGPGEIECSFELEGDC